MTLNEKIAMLDAAASQYGNADIPGVGMRWPSHDSILYAIDGRFFLLRPDESSVTDVTMNISIS